MKEMCRNFVCNTGGCPCQSANACPAATNRAATETARPAVTEDCTACVIKQVGLAQAMVPSQPYEAPMEQEQSLVCGTVFADLVMPYCMGWNFYRYGKEA